MDSASAKRGIFTYSIFESGITGKIDTMYFEQKWKNNHTTLVLRPDWNKSSVYFKGLKPPQRLYIPTDSIAVRITARLKDLARPPLGPNALDIHKTFIPDSTGDTAYTYRIDSIHFTIDSVFPVNKQTGVGPRPKIALTFSSPIYPGTVDTSRYNNKSLLVTTKYNSKLDTARQVIFDSVFISSNRIFFVPKKSFFFGDSVYCYYRGVSARDTLGFSIDMNNDGIPKHFFDSSSREDDYFWSFLIEEITNSGVIPDSGASDVSMKTPISLQFSKPVYPGTIDTARVKNRSLTVTSTYSDGTPILYDSVVMYGNKATFYLNHPLFYADSVFCNFRGLITKDTAGFSIDIGNDTDLTNNKGKKWFFKVEELKVKSVFPDSGNLKATIRTPISLTFSGPVSGLIFDTSLVADSNRSFYGTSSYNGARRILFSGLQFSPDSTTITLHPAKAFYSYDSVTCFFAGYRRGYSYLKIQSLVPIDSQSTVGKYTWYFLTGNEGFYTYPNPFKPGSDPRHRNLGGIWFKNLHALANQRGALSTVTIRIYTMNTHRVVESGPVNFQDGNPEKKPEWFWNTTNGRGAPVSTGVYFYIIYDAQNKMLLKGKILIVR
jgi:hypothetical protein